MEGRWTAVITVWRSAKSTYGANKEMVNILYILIQRLTGVLSVGPTPPEYVTGSVTYKSSKTHCKSELLGTLLF